MSPLCSRVPLPSLVPILAGSMLTACVADGDGPRPLIEGPGFFDAPFPSDTRLVNGHPDLSDFPLQDDIFILSDYIGMADQLDGFGLASPIWVRFEGPLDAAALPTAAASIQDGAGLFLVDIDPTSPERGRRIPVDSSFAADATRWHDGNLLAVQPVWGLPLRPSTRYALVLTKSLASTPRGWTALTDPTSEGHAYLRDLEETLFQLHVDVDDVAYATLFTTQDPTAEMARLVHRMRTGLQIHPLDQALVVEEGGWFYERYQGEIRIPIWQHGVEPYTAEGGGFVFDETGWPELYRMATVEFTLTIPKDAAMPADGWPVVIYSHGTGGDRATFANEPEGTEVASMFAKEGIAGFGISLPFHGDRYAGSEVELVSFNYLNPESGRSAFRQAALEQVWLAEVLTALPHHFTAEDGLVADTDPNRVAYMGHSHGAEIGIMAVPFFHDRVRASVLSSGGGGLSIALLSRDAGDFDIQGILEEVLQLEDGEELTATHPAVGLVQMIAEITDPLHYARYWFAERPRWSATPQNVLVFQGLQDIYTPPPSIGALAAAGHVPFLGPIAETWPAQAFVPTARVDLPAAGTAEAWDGSRVTSGLLQYPDLGHFAVFEDSGAMKAYQQFLATALESGRPEVVTR